MAEVALRNVVKRFDEVEAVRSIDLDIPDSELVVLVGPSGCGKSTTLRMIAGLEEVTSGEIFIGGDLVNDLPPKDRNIAMVFQSYALYPHLSIRDNIGFRLPSSCGSPTARNARGRGCADSRIGALSRSKTGTALRRSTAARGNGPRHCA